MIDSSKHITPTSWQCDNEDKIWCASSRDKEKIYEVIDIMKDKFLQYSLPFYVFFTRAFCLLYRVGCKSWRFFNNRQWNSKMKSPWKFFHLIKLIKFISHLKKICWHQFCCSKVPPRIFRQSLQCLIKPCRNLLKISGAVLINATISHLAQAQSAFYRCQHLEMLGWPIILLRDTK